MEDSGHFLYELAGNFADCLLTGKFDSAHTGLAHRVLSGTLRATPRFKQIPCSNEPLLIHEACSIAELHLSTLIDGRCGSKQLPIQVVRLESSNTHAILAQENGALLHETVAHGPRARPHWPTQKATRRKFARGRDQNYREHQFRTTA